MTFAYLCCTSSNSITMPSKLLPISTEHGVLGSGGYSNLGARGKNFQKLMLSEKKKRSDLGLHIFLPKSRCSLKKKKKGLHSESSSEQTSAANPKLYVLFSRGSP